MKILIICNYSSGLLKFRGLLIRTLIDRGHSVSAVVPWTDEESELQSEKGLEAAHCSLIHLPIERRGMNPLKDAKLLRNYRNVIEKERPDLVVTYTIKPNIYGGIACRILGVPYAANITGLGTAFQNNGMLKTLVTKLYRVALKRAKTVFFENVENRQTLLDAGIVNEEQACLLHGAGVNVEHFSLQPYPEDDSGMRFLFIGRVMREKGVDELFAAMRALRADGIPCTLDVLGGYEEDYQAIMDQYQEEGWLRYHGYQDDVRPFIAECHCFVLPSWHEGMANTNLECAASGRPVITSRIHGCMEAVVDGESGLLCEAKNADSLYRVMKHFCELPWDERKTMGERGRQHMEAVFDKKQVVRETLERLEL